MPLSSRTRKAAPALLLAVVFLASARVSEAASPSPSGSPAAATSSGSDGALTLINTTGMAFLGPGSEWFWAMLQFFVVAITLFAILGQLRAQRSTSVYDQWAARHQDWMDPEFRESVLAFLIDIEGRAIADGLPRSAARVANWFDGLGYLVSQGHIRATDVWNDFRRTIGWWWALMSPYIERDRVRSQSQQLFEWFEDLERKMQKIDLDKTGRLSVVDPETVSAAIDNRLAELQRAREAAQGIIPTRKGVPAPPKDASS
jgi:hypothetical protein